MSHVDEGTLHAYLDGELPAAERAPLEAHLAECASCRDRLTEERGLIERADRLLTLAALPAGHTHRPAPVATEHPRRRPPFVVPAVWAASIALAFLTGWLLRPAPHPSDFATNEARQVAAAAPADTPAPAPVSDAGRAAALYRPSPEHRQAAKVSQDSAARSQVLAVEAETSVVPVVKPGVVENAGRPALRGAAPAPIPPATVAVAPSAPSPQTVQSTDMAMERVERRPIGTTWMAISAEPARKVLGSDVVRIPGIPVRDILQNEQTPGVVMVEQEVAEGTIIQLLQSRLDSTVGATASQPVALMGNPLQKTVGHLQVRISGPLTADSLLKLLDLAR